MKIVEIINEEISRQNASTMVDDNTKKLLDNKYQFDIYYDGQESGNGDKISIVGKTIEDVYDLYKRLHQWLVNKDISHKIATTKRITFPDYEQSKKLVTIYVPDEMDIKDLLLRIEILLSGYKGWQDLRLPFRGYQHYSNGIFFRNDRDANGEYIPAKDAITEMNNSINEGIQVFHGSAQKFDNFDLEKVGSGDGKSLGGWGIYFSTSSDVAERYFTRNGFVGEYDLRNGRYFDLDAPLYEDAELIYQNLGDYNVSENDIEEFGNDFVQYSSETTKKQTYDWLSYVLGSEKNASLFLADLGYLGNEFKDRVNTDATNYVVFNTKTIKSV